MCIVILNTGGTRTLILKANVHQMRCGSDTTSQPILFHSSQCVRGRWLRQADGLRKNTQHFVVLCGMPEHRVRDSTKVK